MSLTGLRFALFAVLMLATLLFVVWVFQRRLIYLPLGQSVPAVDELLPGAEPVRYTTADGLALDGWFQPASTSAPRATVLFFPGNAGNRADRAGIALALARRGFSVLLVDYRGYGGNPGRPSERGLALDAAAALAHLRGRADVDPQRIVYFGESLGGAVALALALDHPPAMLALRSPFTSLVDVAALHYPYLPVRWLLADRYPSLERIARVGCPLIVFAGGADRIVPARQSRALYETATVAERRWVAIDDAGHNDRDWLDGERMLDELDRFWDDVRSGPPAAGSPGIPEER
ncbi:MAG TPA: alpha/beta hydrolase [Candidatus Polarisedimenticolaceae bacterium]|nr:alpha/beta hydrolase [Candidatus Polarisedimenticolaceae bacterium]